jgi:hypothetical protein
MWGAADDREAERAQRIDHQCGIIDRVGERRHIQVVRIADDERHAPVGMRGSANQQAGQRK